MLVSSVQPVVMCRAVFCILCSCVMFVVDALGHHIVKRNSNIDLVTAVYVESLLVFATPCQ